MSCGMLTSGESVRWRVRRHICAILVTSFLSWSAAAQDKLEAPAPKSTSRLLQDTNSAHKFWDKQNAWLFAAVGASRTLDYFSTLNMRRRGRDEILLTNDVVDNHAAFAVIEAAATGLSIGASYLFHRYGHHRLERWTSLVHFGAAATGAVRNYCLETAHVPPVLQSPP